MKNFYWILPLLLMTACNGTAKLTTANGTTTTVTFSNPTLVPGNQSGSETVLLTFSLNGSDPQSAALTFSCISNCPTGMVTDSSAGQVTWTPSIGQAGTYTPTFKATDTHSLSAMATPTITIASTNQPPVINPISAQSVNTGAALNITPVCSDPDNDTVTIGMQSGLPTNSVFSGGVFTFDPDYTQSGQYTVTFTCTDGVTMVTEPVTVTVNYQGSTPIMAPVSNVTIPQNGTTNFSLSASDADGDTITYSSTALPTGATLVGNNLSWTPGCNTFGSYPITFYATDSASMQDSKSMTITVTATDCYRPAWQVASSLSGAAGNSVNANIGSAVDYDTGDTETYHYVADYDCNNHAWTKTFNAGTRTLALTNPLGNLDPGMHSFLVYVVDSFGELNYKFVQVSGYSGSFAIQESLQGATFSTTGLCGGGTVYTH